MYNVCGSKPVIIIILYIYNKCTNCVLQIDEQIVVEVWNFRIFGTFMFLKYI